MRACPFCHEADFDAVGLKVHLSSGHCEAYESTPSPARTVRLGSPLPAATAREEAIRAEVIEECARVCDEQRCRWCRDAGETNPNHADCCASRADAAAIRALALARSTGGAS